jgi:hypothetical protein
MHRGRYSGEEMHGHAANIRNGFSTPPSTKRRSNNGGSHTDAYKDRLKRNQELHCREDWKRYRPSKPRFTPTPFAALEGWRRPRLGRGDGHRRSVTARDRSLVFTTLRASSAAAPAQRSTTTRRCSSWRAVRWADRATKAAPATRSCSASAPSAATLDSTRRVGSCRSAPSSSGWPTVTPSTWAPLPNRARRRRTTCSPTKPPPSSQAARTAPALSQTRVCKRTHGLQTNSRFANELTVCKRTHGLQTNHDSQKTETGSGDRWPTWARAPPKAKPPT